MKVGDLLVVTEGNTKFRAIGEITGDYRCISREAQGDWYGQSRNVKWLRVYKPSLPFNQLMNNQFSQMTLYELRSGSIDMNALAQLLQSKAPSLGSSSSHYFNVGDKFGEGYKVSKVTESLLELVKPNGSTLPLGMSLLLALADYVRTGRLTIADIRDKHVFEKIPECNLERYLVNGYSNILTLLVKSLIESQTASQDDTAHIKAEPNAKVLIIDEINRGNISRIFGELITLLEPSKRSGADEALEVILPYSKQPFRVPSNIYIIGTMNTADRSLSGLDIALRRRFVFKEMPPRPDLINDIVFEGINLGTILLKMNERIEVLLDRDHCLGHAYFMSMRGNRTLDNLAFIFRQQILPLLQEYFFEDWERIAWVLNDQNKPADQAFIQKPSSDISSLFGSETAANLQNIDRRWHINEKAFNNIESYRQIVGEIA